MKYKIQTILNKKHFFNIISHTENTAKYTLNLHSQILLKNIYINWLQYLHIKTQKSMPVYIKKSFNEPHSKSTKPPFGVILNSNIEYKNAILEHNLDKFSPEDKSHLEFHIVFPKEDLMQYFIQWQRYRKYWWSSITTTPSLFGVDDIKQDKAEASVNIMAKLPYGNQPVEHITVKTTTNIENASCLSCSMSLECAFFMLMLDGSSNSDEDYLRLHRKVTPYKISFALHFQEPNKEAKLKKLASLLHYRLKMEKISAWLPNFSMDIETQVKENLCMGVAYTAILSEGTLETGIFYLLNSSTMLKEQIHVADFHKYAALICSAK